MAQIYGAFLTFAQYQPYMKWRTCDKDVVCCDVGRRSRLRSTSARCRGWQCRTQTRPDGHDSTDSMESKVRLWTFNSGSGGSAFA